MHVSMHVMINVYIYIYPKQIWPSVYHEKRKWTELHDFKEKLEGRSTPCSLFMKSHDLSLTKRLYVRPSGQMV